MYTDMEQRQYVYTRRPRPKLYQKRKYRALCYRCGEYGYLGFGRTRNKYRRHYKKYQVQYVRHYSSDVYNKQMVRYRNHEIKSRPNGQRRCYMQSRSRWYKDEKQCSIAYTSVHYVGCKIGFMVEMLMVMVMVMVMVIPQLSFLPQHTPSTRNTLDPSNDDVLVFHD